MLFDRFNNEAEFRARFVRPLLTRLGFISVAELHGQQEYGKDFVFSELTPFGFLRHYAAVVKHEKKISQTSHTLCTAILAQVKQAFSGDCSIVTGNMMPGYVRYGASLWFENVLVSGRHVACRWRSAD